MRTGWETIVHHSSPATLVDSIKEKIKQQPLHSVVTLVNVRPRDVDPAKYSHHASYVEDAVRHWWFSTADGAAQFRKDFL